MPKLKKAGGDDGGTFTEAKWSLLPRECPSLDDEGADDDEEEETNEEESEEVVGGANVEGGAVRSKGRKDESPGK